MGNDWSMSSHISEPPLFTPIEDPRPVDTPWPTMSWPIPPTTELTGSAVLLTPLDPNVDALSLFQALDHDRVWAHVPGRPANPEEFAEFLRGRCADPTWHPWTVRAAGPGDGGVLSTVVGITSYLDVAVHDARLEIGMTLYTPSVWSTAVNPESKLLLLSYAFDELRVGRVQLKTDVRNARSQQAIARLGAQYEGTIRRSFRRTDGTIRDSVLFSVTSDDWPRVRRGLTERLAR